MLKQSLQLETVDYARKLPKQDIRNLRGEAPNYETRTQNIVRNFEQYGFADTHTVTQLR